LLIDIRRLPSAQDKAMATQKRTRAPRKPSSTSNASGKQLAGTSETESTQDSAVLRAGFDTAPFEGQDAASSEASVRPTVTFVGERLAYKDRNTLIAERAYRRAEQRGFGRGYELDDWLAAEKEVDALLSPDGNLGAK
jgi:hypothetical protein